MILKIQGKCISKDNEKYRSKAGHVFTSKRFKDYELGVALQARSQLKSNFKAFTKDIVVGIKFFFDSKVHPDLTNCPKGILDALQGLVYKNDKQIKQCYMAIYYVKTAPCVELIIEEISND